MKKPVKKEVILLLLVVPILIFVGYFMGVRREGSLPNYSVINKSKKGISIFYESLEKSGYSVKRSLEPLEEDSFEKILFMVESYNYTLEEGDALWKSIEEGISLIYLGEEYNEYLDTKSPDSINEYYKIYSIGEGQVLYVSPEVLSNIALVEDEEPAYEVIKEIEAMGQRTIVFNEYYLYGGGQEKNLWESIPIAFKVLLFQLALSLGAWYYFKGKAFGRAVPYYEEEERLENEYIYNTASIYRRVEAYDLMAQSYYSGLLRGVRATSETFAAVWEKEKLPKLKEAKKVQSFMEDTFFKGKSLQEGAKQFLRAKEKRKKKEYIEIISLMEELGAEINKRRDTNWKIAGL